MAQEPLNKLVSNKTGKEIFLNEADTKLHLKLHGRQWANHGPTTEYTPEEAKQENPAPARKQAVIAPKE